MSYLGHTSLTDGDVAKQEVVISDSTSSAKLILYGDDVSTLVQEKSHLLKTLRFNSFKDAIYLNSTQVQKFEFEQIDEVEQCH